MKVLAGLGNPGDQYKSTRHNIGFIITGYIAEKYSITGKFESKFNAIIGKGFVNAVETLIIQPQTYMNLSGEAIAKILNFYKVEPSELLVIYDDLTLDLGKIRFRPSGSDGGHNGMKSIINCMKGNREIPRLKVGVGPQLPNMPSEAFVLQKFPKQDDQILEKVVSGSTEAIEYYIAENLTKAQNKYNGADFSK